MNSRTRFFALAAVIVALAGAAFAVYMIWFRVRLPAPGSPEYAEYVRVFQVGVAAIDAERLDLAEARLDKAIELAPGEPAAWANRGLLHLRQNNKAAAAHDLKRAHDLAPESGEIEALLGQLAQAEGDYSKSVSHLRKAVEKNPRDLTSLYALAEAVSKENTPGTDAEYQRLMERILDVQPNNLHVLMKRASAAF